MLRNAHTWTYAAFVVVANMLTLCMMYILTIPQPVVRMNVSQPYLDWPERSVPTVPAVSGIPNRLVITSLGVDIKVGVGRFDPDTGLWTINGNKVFYANNSVPANDTNGTTLIYGHAQWGIFAILPDLKPDARAVVYTDTGHRFEYRYTSVRMVVPTDTEIFTDKGKPKLVLQTCAGPWDAYRALYGFKFVKERTA